MGPIAMAKETAEKKLLKLIEQTEAQEASIAAAPSDDPREGEAAETLQAVQSVGVAGLRLPPFLQPLNAVFGFLRRAGSGEGPLLPRRFGLREFNMLLACAAAGAAIFLARDLRSGMALVHRGPVLPDLASAARREIRVNLPSVRDLNEYLARVSARNIFQPFQPKTRQAAETAADAPAGPDRKAEAREKASTLRLVGISWQDDPGSLTALIEDVNTSVTHFLRKGDEINGVTIKDILRDRVILTYEGETITVKM